MNVEQQSHPTEQQLQAFTQGALDEQASSRIEAHLLACDRCCEAIARQPDSTLLRLARDAATIGFRDGRQQRAAAATGEIPLQLVDHPRYQVIKRIGQGGMGAVYLAEHRMMQRSVALKVIHPSLLADQQHIERFRREVLAAAKLSHPNIVTAYDADQAGELNFLVMEHVEGISLDAAFAQRRVVAVGQACEWIRQAALGLQHAHEQGMVHRDIKPHNLMVAPDGTIKILDFGLTRLASDQSSPSPAGERPTAGPRPTSQGMILGTPDYIAPEQIADSSTADIRADIYSLGCTLFHALAGAPPFPGGTILEKLHAHGSKPLPRLQELRPDVPAALVAIIDRMTAKEPADRYASPGDVARELEPYCDRASGAPPVPPPIIGEASAAADRETPIALQVAPTLRVADKPARAVASRRATKPPTIFQGPLLNFLLIAAVPLAGCLIAIVWPLLRTVGNGEKEPTVVKADDSSAQTDSAPVANASSSCRLLLLLPSRGLWFGDFRKFRDAVRAADGPKGAAVELVVAGTSRRPALLEPTSELGVAEADVLLSPQLSAADFDALVVIGYDNSEFAPGGAAAEQAMRLIRDFQNQGKVIASLCAGQRLLAQHDLVRGRQVAACKYVDAGELGNWGGSPVARRVVQDGRLITAAAEDDAPLLVETIVAAVQE